MKKILALALCVMVCVTACACSSSGQPNKIMSVDSTTAPTTAALSTGAPVSLGPAYTAPLPTDVPPTDAPTTEPVTTPSQQTKMAYIAGSNVNVRKGPSTDDDKVTQLGVNTQVEVLGEQNGWSQISFNSTTGYVRNDFLSDSPVTVTSKPASSTPKPTATKAPSATAFNENLVTSMDYTAAYINASDVNMRKAPVSGDVIQKLDKYTSCIISGKYNDWYRIIVNSKTGYVRSDFVTRGAYGTTTTTTRPVTTQAPVNTGTTLPMPTTGSGTYTTTFNQANLYSTASTTGLVKASVPAGTQVVPVTLAGSNWVYVICSGQAGYMLLSDLNLSATDIQALYQNASNP